MPKNYHLFLKGGVGGWDFNTEYVNYVLDKYKDQEVHVLINSLGGDAYTALAISPLFKLHGNVHVHFVGANASAATIAAMGAKRITIDAGACFLVHKCLGFVFEWDWLNAEELDSHIKQLEKKKANQEVLDSCVAGMYARRCKKTKDELLDLMSKDTWLTPEQALEWGFVDEITDNDEDKAPALSENALAALASAGIPAPPGAAIEKGSMMARFISFFKPFFNNQAPDTEGAAKNSPLMATLTAISALLGCTLAASGDKFILSDAQADTINSTLDANKKTIDELTATVTAKTADLEKANTDLAALRAEIEEKDRTIADLRKEPASSTDDVVDDKRDEDPYAPVAEAEALAASRAFLDATK